MVFFETTGFRGLSLWLGFWLGSRFGFKRARSGSIARVIGNVMPESKSPNISSGWGWGSHEVHVMPVTKRVAGPRIIRIGFWGMF